MSMKYYQKILLAAGAAFVFALAGCTIKNKGTARENQPPSVFFSPVPLENSIFSAPGQFFWFASDPDGYIVEFQYSVQFDSAVRNSVKDSTGKPVGTPADFIARNAPDNQAVWNWVSVENLTTNGQTDTIALPATPRLNDTLFSVVFLRALDDKGAYSNIAWRRYGRQNRAPRTHLNGINGFTSNFPVFYSLDSRTFDDTLQVGHTGLTISWFGSDSLDYPKTSPPPFSYFWELFGPFANEAVIPINPVDSSKLWASSDRPDHYKPDSILPGRFVRDQSVTFFGLKGFDSLTNFRTGAYLFRVRARDDAGAVDTSLLAQVRFTIIKPRFDRKILLLYKKYLAINTGEPDTLTAMFTQGYYLNLIRLAGYGNDMDSLLDLKDVNEFFPIAESTLARYRLVIFHKEGLRPSNAGAFMSSLRNYTNAGGSVWGLGRDDLIDFSGQGAGIACPPLVNGITYNNTNPVDGIAFFYYAVNAMFNQCHFQRLSPTGDSVSAEEFIGAEPSPFVPDFPLLDIDTNVVKAYLAFSHRKSATPYYQRIPGVNFFSRAVRSEPLYLFRTPFADTSQLSGKVVALRSDRKSFKTAQFGFSLFGIQEPQAAILMRKMLEWFIGPPQ